MKIIVSNLWPRAKFYEDVPEIAKRLNAYRGDPVIDACDALAPIESFENDDVDIEEFYKKSSTAKAAESISDESDVFGGLSQEGIAPEILRQYVFFTLILRALYLKHTTNISVVVGYCSGIIPVLNAMAVETSSKSTVFQLPDLLLQQLSIQDAAVKRNVLDHDVVMAIVRLNPLGLTHQSFVGLLKSDVGRGVYVTDWKAESVASVCGPRKAMNHFLAGLREETGEPIGPVRLVPHGGLHTPLAAPNDCFNLEGGPKWQSLLERVQRSGQVVWTSAARSIDPHGGIDEFEGVMRDTLFGCVQTGNLVEKLCESDEEIRCVGLPSVVSDMFLGSGMRIGRGAIIGPEAL